jgi:hypothetical protein
VFLAGAEIPGKGRGASSMLLELEAVGMLEAESLEMDHNNSDMVLGALSWSAFDECTCV